MNPWEAIGWLVFIVLALIVLWLVLGAIVVGIEKLVKLIKTWWQRRKHRKDPRKFDFGRLIRDGDIITVGPQDFKVTMVESDYDLERDRYKFRLTMEGESGSASKLILFDS